MKKISYSKARAMTRAATAENEEFLLMVARHGTAAHVEHVVRNRELMTGPTFPNDKPNV